ncbi:MAG: LEA type 2 family protein [Phycisphaerae bacterium]|nr:LEA type 2 family protein [Phycisphaerae bacterium]
MTKFARGRRLVATGAGMLLAALGGCGMFEKPNARITGVTLQDVRAAGSTLLFDVQVDNPNTIDLPMSDVDYALSSGGQPFVNGKADVQGTLPAGGSKTLGVPVQIRYAELIRAVAGARPGATIPYTAEMGFSVDVPLLGSLRVPVSKEGQLAIPSTDDLLQRLRDLAR